MNAELVKRILWAAVAAVTAFFGGSYTATQAPAPAEVRCKSSETLRPAAPVATPEPATIASLQPYI